jgi:eukaryotic-like serine/threonine-protein kinase
MAKVETTSDATVIGRIIVEQGLASSDEVDACLRSWQEASSTSGESLAAHLVKKGVVTPGQVRRIRSLMDERRDIQQIPGYELMGKLGSGAMADVYRARQLSLDREVAIKVLPKRFTEDPAFVDRFYAEGRAAAKLNHPNIVQAIDVGNAGDRHYFVMELVEGSTVFDHLQKHGRYKEADALSIVIQIADALKHAHEKGFIHRDVKPKNIMITKSGIAKLADMGLARQVSDREAAEAEAGKAFGTPFYISPEQIRGEVDVDARCDIYGLGATFYHMVTGRVPFEGPNPSAVMHKHLRNELVPPDHLNAKLSAGISEIIEVMMAKDRTERYTSAAALLEDLRAVVAGDAPLQARKRFSMASLAKVEESGEVPEYTGPMTTAQQPMLLEQPMFWGMALSVALNLLLLIVLLMYLIS